MEQEGTFRWSQLWKTTICLMFVRFKSNEPGTIEFVQSCNTPPGSQRRLVSLGYLWVCTIWCQTSFLLVFLCISSESALFAALPKKFELELWSSSLGKVLRQSCMAYPFVFLTPTCCDSVIIHCALWFKTRLVILEDLNLSLLTASHAFPIDGVLVSCFRIVFYLPLVLLITLTLRTLGRVFAFCILGIPFTWVKLSKHFVSDKIWWQRIRGSFKYGWLLIQTLSCRQFLIKHLLCAETWRNTNICGLGKSSFLPHFVAEWTKVFWSRLCGNWIKRRVRSTMLAYQWKCFLKN